MIDDHMVLPEIMMTAAGWNTIADEFDPMARRSPVRFIAVLSLAALIAGVAVHIYRKS